jgi:acetolactate synthase-1/2/3 large subunit
MSSKRLEDGRLVSKPLEDLAPFLDREELMTNMLIELLPEEF